MRYIPYRNYNVYGVPFVSKINKNYGLLNKAPFDKINFNWGEPHTSDVYRDLPFIILYTTKIISDDHFFYIVRVIT